MQHVVDRYVASLRLPLGHVERKHAQRAVDAEYEKCHALEDDFLKTWKGPAVFTYQQALDVANKLCAALGVRGIKAVEFSREPYNYYCTLTRTIHIWHPSLVPIQILVHELAHHVVHREDLRGEHGEDFLMVEGLLFEALQQMYPETKT